MTCSGDPVEGRGCPAPSTRFVISPAAVAVEHVHDDTAPELGWVLIAFCPRHRSAVLDFVEGHVGPDLWMDAVVAELAMLPVVVDQLGLGPALDGGEPVLTNVALAAS